MSEGQATATKSGAPDPLIGRVIADRFKIRSLIARGGMGKVYRAEQAPLGRLCAVKVLNPNYNGDADPEFHRRFFREASITSKITHPNSVTIFDYGKTDDDIYFMAMEYLEGRTLHMALREDGVMDEVRAGRIATQICRAVREAHKLGVIHRDLKPANIFLTRPNMRLMDDVERPGSMPPLSEDDEDFVKVLDFGLVKHLSERPEEQLTQTGLFMGSPKYMAPEQIQGGHVDERTDIYSLGIIMYEMLAGKVPFERATSVNILMAHVGEPPPPMRAVNPNLVCSAAFEELVMSCIAKDPNDRVPSMDRVIAAIRRAHGGSVTGQVAAVQRGAADRTGGSAPPAAIGSQPPPVVSSTLGPIAAASGAHGPLGASGVEMANPSVSGFVAKSRSSVWIVGGVLVAVAMGSGFGLLAFKYSAPMTAASSPPLQAQGRAASPTVTSNAQKAEPSAEGTVATRASSSARVVEALAPLHMTTDPPGAAVHEGDKELCPATPCDLDFGGVSSGGSKVHKLLVTRAGFRPETRSVKTGDATLHVKLVRVGGVGVRPTPTGSPVPPVSAAPESTTPNGFKDLPY